MIARLFPLRLRLRIAFFTLTDYSGNINFRYFSRFFLSFIIIFFFFFSSLLETIITEITPIYICPLNKLLDKSARIRKIFSLYIIFSCIRTFMALEDGSLRQNLLLLFR